ncbi:segregation/condensation protein A [Virgibacillus sp. LDC1]|uniref:segregation and condensation protein A n=1 Tax=Paenibacillus TaxID=44249 RepID=UPI000C27514E|nr:MULTISPECIES: segregation/condensation protein A [Paenibacillus]MCV4230147.1 segregation/condensation protein A [Virgibacillus sp. LDC1]MEC0205771.1 segregation/condensation protein A [Paenibacillus lautus]PJN53951.1 Segregation and condensation protein A [Paenibacillus sp. GM2FR]
MTVLYKLETFEGPLDLLLHLIDKAEIDIQDIPVSEITEQYMAYLHNMQELELEITSEFLVMAATLLSIKSKLLLPKPPVIEMDEFDFYEEDDMDPRAELIAKLIEYRKYKGIARHLHEKEWERSLIYSKEAEDLTPYMPEVEENPVQGLHISDLIAAFQKALNKAVKRTSYARIQRDEISVKDRIRQVMDALEEVGPGGRILFSKLLHEEMVRHEIVVTFLAILELMKMKQILCYQEKLFEDIVMEWRGEGRIDGLSEAEIDY